MKHCSPGPVRGAAGFEAGQSGYRSHTLKPFTTQSIEMMPSSLLSHWVAEETEVQRWNPKYPGLERQSLAELGRESSSLVSQFIGSFFYTSLTSIEFWWTSSLILWIPILDFVFLLILVTCPFSWSYNQFGAAQVESQVFLYVLLPSFHGLPHPATRTWHSISHMCPHMWAVLGAFTSLGPVMGHSS